MKSPILYIVVPCYNEAACLRETTKRLTAKLSTLQSSDIINKSSKIVYVDDGSHDDTWEIIASLNQSDNHIIGLKLAHNRGHQNALLAGLMYAKEYADAVISMDADLQDDIDTIDRMLTKFHDGYEIVYGVRSNRESDSSFKRHTAQGFYKLMHFLGVETIYNAADYRLMSRRALDELANYSEVNLFLRGIIPLIGLKWTTVEYKRGARFAGESKYPLGKMLNFAWDGITSFSIKPLRLILIVGWATFFISLLFLLYSIFSYLSGSTVDGWTFLACSIWLVGGLEMVCIGIIGEYLGKVYAESKHRPRYFIEEITHDQQR